MRLETARVKNFRSCRDTTVHFDEHVTLLVGENDAGKSNIIDALRAVTPPAAERRSLWFDAERDLTYGSETTNQIEVQRVYSDLTPTEDGIFMAALVDADRKLVHTTTLDPDPGVARRHRVSHSVGRAQISDPEPENRERIAHVYLPPLRDAGAALDSGRGDRLAEIFEISATEAEINTFREVANAALAELADDAAARKAVTGIQEQLTAVTQPVRQRFVDLRHRNQELRALVRALRLHMAGAGLEPADLAGSGLGYANLLFIATVVLQLERASEFDLMVLLVEEPEAHLHPQLQSVLLEYLCARARESATAASPPGDRTGRIQVVATTHSPHFASSLSTSAVVVVRASLPETEATSDATAPPSHPESRTVALSQVALSPAERRKVDRYLDATRASLLFARQIILVEGIAEALLLRAVAEHVVFPRAKDLERVLPFNKPHREQFRAISVQAIGGVDFMPYLRLLLHEDGAIVDRVVVVTDGDSGAGAVRKSAIDAAFPDHISSGVLVVEVGETTLEAELYALEDNEAILKAAFLDQHPRSLAKWEDLSLEDASSEQRAQAFVAAIRNGNLDLGKGDFAQGVAERLQGSGVRFAVPRYLEAAIRGALVPVEGEGTPHGP